MSLTPQQWRQWADYVLTHYPTNQKHTVLFDGQPAIRGTNAEVALYGYIFAEFLESEAQITPCPDCGPDGPFHHDTCRLCDGDGILRGGEPAVTLTKYCPLCPSVLQYRGLIAGVADDQEMWRFDCPSGHTVLADFTRCMGDDREDDA